MNFPEYRPRRLRGSESIRRLVRETALSVNDLVYPLFAAAGKGIKRPVESMPGIFNLSVDIVAEEAQKAWEMGIPAVLLFGVPDFKDSLGTGAYAEDGVVQQAVREIKRLVPNLLVITDVCLCEYTDHGHCGIVEGGRVLNDPTLDLLARTAVSHVRSGADMVAPSDMMDGRVAAIRKALDSEGCQETPIMAYSVKYSSAYYGPFREAAGSAPQFGDRRAYQMDPPNAREALREASLDIAEGADIIIVKPALAYLDIVRMIRESFDYPLAVYNVSGEYSMVKAAAKMGWIDERKIVTETLTGMKRSGADIIITYHALDVAGWLKEGL
ncbi:MAG: delta-aminolevulinic acid dehydratase [Peptococcaceae bacterium BICA1-7]|nr:MAG: delta-aminolevulinic acid dehydratase [Peptococcaceae bacterium BICA1-7]